MSRNSIVLLACLVNMYDMLCEFKTGECVPTGVMRCVFPSWMVNTAILGVWECVSDLWDLPQVDGGECACIEVMC